MRFSRTTILEAWKLALGRCECQREGHGHGERCNRSLVLAHHGKLNAEGWIAVPWKPFEAGGADDPENVEVLCWDCYRQGIRQASEKQGVRA